MHTRTCFVTNRTAYTSALNRTTRSGSIAEGLDHGEGDDEIFYGNEKVVLFMHLAFGRSAPRYCMRDHDANQQADLGIDGKSESPSQVTPGKRSHDSVTNEGLKEAFATIVPKSTEEKKALEENRRRDSAMAEYFNEQKKLTTFEMREKKVFFCKNNCNLKIYRVNYDLNIKKFTIKF